MRDMYAVSFVKLVDSAWMPKVEMKTFKGFRLGGSDDYIGVKTSANQEPSFEQISVQKFKSKEEFIGYMVQESIGVWDKYEAAKQFEKESQDIIADIEQGKVPDKNDLIEDIDDFYSDSHDNVKKYYASEKNKIVLTDEEILQKAAEIQEKDIGDGWKPYLALKEIAGIDLINTPDTATEENVADMRSKRPDPENNSGIVRRARKRIMGDVT